MTPHECLDWIATQPLAIGSYLVALPILAIFLALAHRRGTGNNAPWKYIYAVLVYAACVPGMFAAVVTLYLILFVRTNLLEVNALVTIAPLVSMAATLAIAGRNVSFGPLPGFGRLGGLMVALGLTFAVIFALSRTHLWIVFSGSMLLLGVLGVFVFALIKWGGYLAFRRHDEPPLPPPKLGA
jgi:hypothetical protein